MKKIKWLPMMHDRSRDIEERVFTLVSLIALLGMSITIIGFVLIYLFADDSILKKFPFSVILLSTIIILSFFTVCIVLAMRFQKYKLGAIILSAFMGFLMFPVNFFMTGGPFGGSLIWFVNYLLYICLVLSGRTKRFFFLISIAVASACFYIFQYHPECMITCTQSQMIRTNILSLITAGSMVYFYGTFGVKAFQDETKYSRNQAQEIAALSDAQNRFFSSMSHEIRTPINTIIGFNEMNLREDTSPEVRENAEHIEAASKMLLQVINDILDMSRLESGHMELAIAPYRTEDMLSELMSMFWLQAKEKNLQFRVDVAPDLPEMLYGDEMRIMQILVNILNNAVKYTNEGSITLQLQYKRQGKNMGGSENAGEKESADASENADNKDFTGGRENAGKRGPAGNRENAGEHDSSNGDGSVIYSVTDTGIGIKKENIPQLFNAFRRVTQDNNLSVEGTGLGLTIVKQLVDLMGGTVSVNSVYTRGSTFIIEIPQKAASAQPIGEISTGHHRSSPNRETYHHSFEAPDARVLVVDDTVSNLLVIKKLLRDTKVQVTTAESGREALKATQETAYHVIFMDHLMPEMDGIECLRQIRTQPGGLSKEAMIIALTANAGSDLKAMYAREGFDGYLVKPVSGKDLERELFHALPQELVFVKKGSEAIIDESTAWITDHQMKVPVAITTESVADLPPSLQHRYNIAVVPHCVTTKNGMFRDGTEIDTRGLLEYMRTSKDVVVDRPPDPSEYEQLFAQTLQRANNVIHISITSKVRHSGCFSALEAAETFENVSVVDSAHLSCGLGLMVLEACQMAKEGKTSLEIRNALEKLKDRVNTTFIVDDLNYLARANQIGYNLALTSKAFMIHPIIELRKGEMKVKGLCFGSREMAWKSYIKSTLDIFSPVDRSRLFIAYVGLTHRELEHIRGLINQRIHFDYIYFQEASPSIAVNCGPGAFGLIFKKQY